MKPSYQFKLATFSLTVLALMSGCQSGVFRKPDLGRLAFWKQDELSLASKRDDIPPPSHHFSPDDGLADAGSSSKQQGSSSKQQGSDLKSNIDDIIAEAKRTQQAKAEALVEPIRKPYSLDKIDPKLTLNHSESTAKELSERVQGFGSATKNAIASTTGAMADKAAEATEKGTNAFGGWKNTFEAAGENQFKQATGLLQEKASSVANSTASALNNVANGAQSTFGQAIKNVRTNVDNSFQPSSSKVVTNPFAASNKTTESSSLAAGSTSKGSDFASRFNQALSDTESTIANATKAADSSIQTAKTNLQSASEFVEQTTNQVSSPTQPSFSDNSSEIRQSSFDRAVSGATAAILQPIGTTSQPLRPTVAQPTTPSFSTSTTTTTSQPLTATTSNAASQYPTTSYGVIKPVSTGSTATSTDNGFAIPPHLLRGEGTFSPGSTRPLRPVQER